MTGNNYQSKAMCTATLKCRDMANAALGLAGKAGEVEAEMKKCLYQEREWDSAKIIEKLGDVLWYVALTADMLNVPLDFVMEYNLDKLQKRYPDEFSFEASEKRADMDTLASAT